MIIFKLRSSPNKHVSLTFLGAYVNKRLNLDLSGAAKMCFIVASMSLAFSSLLYIKCDTKDIAGVNKPYPNRLEHYYEQSLLVSK